MADQHAETRPPLSLAALREKINAGEIDTVLVVFPDTNGRLVGKRSTAHCFLHHCTGTLALLRETARIKLW